jgi:hypothetical protein
MGGCFTAAITSNIILMVVLQCDAVVVMGVGVCQWVSAAGRSRSTLPHTVLRHINLCHVCRRARTMARRGRIPMLRESMGREKVFAQPVHRRVLSL